MKTPKILKFIVLASAIITICLSGALITAPHETSAATTNGYEALNFNPQIKLPTNGMNQATITVGTYSNGVMTSNLLAKYIKAFYDYGIAIGGILATIVLMGAGVLWLTSGGNDSKISQAKELIVGSIAGLAILFGSWVLLNTVNPDLLVLKEIKTKYLEMVVFGCCQKNDGSVDALPSSRCISPNIFHENMVPNYEKKICEAVGCCTAPDAVALNKYSSCVQITNSACFDRGEARKQGGKNFYTWQQTLCEDIPECENIKSNCVGIKDGEACENVDDAYCYGGVCYAGDGQEKEPCGNDGGSTCLKSGSKCDDKDSSGGRDCGKNLFCCYKVNE